MSSSVKFTLNHEQDTQRFAQILSGHVHSGIIYLIGDLGAGKTTLVNSLDPTLDLRTGEISTFHEQGKHTTTFAEMHQLQSGGYIIDTPGIRAFGVIDLEKEHLM
jgi:ribosome biogenesis GTPase